MPSLDLRPAKLDGAYRPGDSFSFEITGPAGWLTSRSFSGTLGSHALSFVESTDTLVVSASGTTTAAETSGCVLTITETVTDKVYLTGHWSPRTDGQTSHGTAISLTFDSVDVSVTIIGGGLVDGGGAVSSVNGDTGDVVLTAADIGSTATGDVSATDVQAAIAELASEKQTAAQVAAAIAALSGTYQPLDSDLTAVANLSPSNDDLIQRKAGAWTNRTMAQLLSDLAAVGTTFQPLDSDLTAIAALTTTSFGRAFLALADAAATRSTLGLVIGTDVEAHDADLTTIGGLSPTNDDIIQRKSGAWANRTMAQLIADLAALGTTFQPLDSDLTTIAGLTATTDNFLVAASSAWASRTPAQAATSLGAEVFKQAQAVNAQTGTTYTLVAGDGGKLVTLSNASPVTLTLPQDSDATIAVGTYVDLYALGAGQVTVAAGTGATLRTSGLTAKSRAQYARFGVQKVSANTWSLYGDLAAS